MKKSSDLKQRIKNELSKELQLRKARVKKLNEDLSFNCSVSGSFKGLGSTMAQSATDKRIQNIREQLEIAESNVVWFENISKRYK